MLGVLARRSGDLSRSAAHYPRALLPLPRSRPHGRRQAKVVVCSLGDEWRPEADESVEEQWRVPGRFGRREVRVAQRPPDARQSLPRPRQGWLPKREDEHGVNGTAWALQSRRGHGVRAARAEPMVRGAEHQPRCRASMRASMRASRSDPITQAAARFMPWETIKTMISIQRLVRCPLGGAVKQALSRSRLERLQYYSIGLTEAAAFAFCQWRSRSQPRRSRSQPPRWQSVSIRLWLFPRFASTSFATARGARMLASRMIHSAESGSTMVRWWVVRKRLDSGGHGKWFSSCMGSATRS